MKKGGEHKGNQGEHEADIDALFKLSPPEFVTARNTLVTALKKSGNDDQARYVKGFAKPSVSAWTVNQLFWRHRIAYDKLIATGERFRQAQVSRLAGGGGDLRALLNERRDTLSELSRLAADVLKTASGAAPPGVMRRVTATLEALSAYGTLAGAPQAGHLVEDVDPPGFDTLAALVPRVGDGAKGDAPSRLLSFQKQAPPARKKRPAGSAEEQEKQRREQLTAARAATQDATRSLADAKKVAEKAQATLKKAATHARDTEQVMVDTEERLQKVASLAHEARQRARRAAVEAESAAQAVEEAERALARARKDVDALEK